MITEKIRFSDVHLTDGFFEKRRKLNRDVTLGAVRARFEDTGRFDAFKFEWTEGMPKKPHIFWDSDVAKWLESAAYILKADRDAALEEYCDNLISLIDKNRGEDGYFNIYFTVVEPENRFTVRGAHELYCAGHLIEAAVAYYEATGKDKLLNVVCDYVACIEKAFVTEKTAEFSTPGHEEIELALVKLYELTGEKKYLDLSNYFVNTRGTAENDGMGSYDQSNIPVREINEAVGHSVRACYLYSAMADLARINSDNTMLEACRRVFKNITDRRMYVTGGIGSTRNGEMFTTDYDLPDSTAYSETCAAISLCYFAHRMTLLEPKSEYADVVEKTLFNSVISGISLDGISFFYENPLEINMFERKCAEAAGSKQRYPITQRVEVFDCSCCPPNITRLMATLGDYIYTTSEDTLFVHQYFSNNASFEHNGRNISASVATAYPDNGSVAVTAGEGFDKIALRIPGWCRSYSVKLDGKRVEANPVDGYIYLNVGGISCNIELELDMKPELLYSNPAVRSNNRKAVLIRGPLVYCIESIDNVDNLDSLCISLPLDYTEEYNEAFSATVCKIKGTIRTGDKLYGFADSYPEKPCTLNFIPYFAFANRGESDMKVWVNCR